MLVQDANVILGYTLLYSKFASIEYQTEICPKCTTEYGMC